MKDSKTGIRRIAQQTGVSTATVSQVLNCSLRVSEHTRKRVLDVIDHSAYQPNAAAKALATNRTRTIAAVVQCLSTLSSSGVPALFTSVYTFYTGRVTPTIECASESRAHDTLRRWTDAPQALRSIISTRMSL